MKDDKHIDDLFQKELGNYQTSPPPEAWDNIRAELDKRKRRRVIPIWWRAAGVAALLALILTVGNAIFNDVQKNESLTEQETVPLPVEDALEGIQDDAPIRAEESIVATEEAAPTDTEDDQNVLESDKAEGIMNGQTRPEDTKAVAVQNKRTDKPKNTSDPGQFKDPEFTAPVKDEKAVAAANTTDRETQLGNRPDDPENKPRKGLDTDNEKLVPPATETGIAGNDTESKAGKTITDDTEKAEEKVSIFEAIAEQEEKLEEETMMQDPSFNRWEVTPSLGPVYYSSIGNGSSIDPTFADNSQSGEVNFSYGAQLSYAISEKLTIRTGVHNVNLSYQTGDVELGTGPVSAALETVDYGNRSTVTTAVDRGTLSTSGSDSGGPFGGLVPKSSGVDAFINQSLRYFEVPLELKYAFVDSRFGVHVIGGFSSLFLADNEISVEAGDFNAVLGEANNLNSLSFTTNIGLGFDYKLGKKLKFNIEPMFKYQVNPYSDSSVDFNPFYLGVYSGLSFRF